MWRSIPWASEAAWLYSDRARQAPQFAASLVGAMITLTSLAFSITMVVLTLAAQQLGPRLIQIFMADRGTKFALGLFLGTVVYLLLVLRALDADDTGHRNSGAPEFVADPRRETFAHQNRRPPRAPSFATTR